MLKWIGRILATIGGVMVFVAALGWASLFFIEKEEKPPAKIILALNFDQELAESPSANPIRRALGEEGPLLTDFLAALNRAEKDSRVVGLVARFGSAQPSIAQIQEIGAAIKKFKASGKFTYAFAHSFGDFSPAERGYWLASYFDEIWLQPVGTLGLAGMSLESPFGKSLLERLGVAPEFGRREEYKSVMESFTEKQFTAPVKENLESLLGNLWLQMRDDVAANRKLAKADTEKFLGAGPYTAEEALSHKLIDRVAYLDELEIRIKAQAGKDSGLFNALAYLHSEDTERAEKTTEIALIHIDGAIVEDHENTSDGMVSGREIAAALRDAAEDKHIAAILLRVNSPGGSPVGSEIIRRAFHHVRQAKKPIIVSMAGVAGSGGYWVAMDADQILALPGTLTGSIGVVAGKFNLGGVWDKLEVNWDGVQRGENAGFWSARAGFSPQQRNRLEAILDSTYLSFKRNVGFARNLSPEQMQNIAKGRVFSGEQALSLGLVDKLGGYQDAAASLRETLKLEANAPLDFIAFPAPESPQEAIFKIINRLGLNVLALESMSTEMQFWQNASLSLRSYLENHGTVSMRKLNF